MPLAARLPCALRRPRPLAATAVVGAAVAMALMTGVVPATAASGTALVPSGSVGAPNATRSVVYGDITVTQAGRVLDALDIHGRVIVKAENVTIKNSIIRGTDAGGKYGLVDAMAGKAGLKISDSEIVATKPNYTVNGIMGSNFELHRVNIHNTVDGVDIAGSNVVVADSWLHGTVHYTNDPSHSDGSHDDNIQVVAGSNIRITGNTMTDAQNTAMMIAQDSGTVSGVTIQGNKLDNGDCTVNINDKGKGAIRGLVATGNLFGVHGSVSRCAVYSPTSPVAMTGNTWTDGSAAVLSTH